MRQQHYLRVVGTTSFVFPFFSPLILEGVRSNSQDPLLGAEGGWGVDAGRAKVWSIHYMHGGSEIASVCREDIGSVYMERDPQHFRMLEINAPNCAHMVGALRAHLANCPERDPFQWSLPMIGPSLQRLVVGTFGSWRGVLSLLSCPLGVIN